MFRRGLFHWTACINFMQNMLGLKVTKTGCIVLIKSRRKEIADSGDTELIVE